VGDRTFEEEIALLQNQFNVHGSLAIAKMKDMDNTFENFLIQKQNEMRKSYRSSIKPIYALFREYSANDVAVSLFVSSIWLPNIASPVKHLLLTAIFATIRADEFSEQDSITTYSDFKSFFNKAYRLVPSFPSMEDFVPEPDWGEVKFHHEEKNYKMFYGSELSNTNEYLALFQMIYGPYDNEYMRHSNRSPMTELQYCLRLQEEIITRINCQPNSESLQISPGNIELPPAGFWRNVRLFYTGFNPHAMIPEPFLIEFSVELGKYPKDSLNYEKFSEMIFTGALLRAFFVKDGCRYYPILPRRYSAVLFDKWSSMYQRYNSIVEPDRVRYSIRLGAELFQYIQKRQRRGNALRLVSALDKKGVPHHTLFPVAFVSRDRLVMLFMTQPSASSKATEQEIKRNSQDLKKAILLASSQPITLAMHIDRQNVQFRSESGKAMLKPELIIVVPQVSTELGPIRMPKSTPGRLMFLDAFLGIIDEMDQYDDFADFLEYFDGLSGHTHSFLSMLDMFASFKDSEGVLISGAIQPTFISLDPHWGTSRRFKTLSSFWKLFPEAGSFDHPRAWRIEKETETRTRLIARGYLGAVLFCKIGSTCVTITAPFHEMDYPRGNISNLLMECLEDSMSQRISIIEKHLFFKRYDRLHVNVFPLSIVANNDRFEHLSHLCKITTLWRSDIGFPGLGEHAVRIVYDDERVSKALLEADDRSFDVDILLEVIEQLNEVAPDSQLGSIREKLEKTRAGKPRFKLFITDKFAAFPELISPFVPEPKHFKQAKKRVAEIARELGLKEETAYELEDAKGILDVLRDGIVSEIDHEVGRHDFGNDVPFLLARIDALNDEYERSCYTLQNAITHEVDYEPEIRYAGEHNEFLRKHKNYRYLIEKFVQLQPRGKEVLGKDQFQYLIALIDWLHVFYSASDNLHYELFSVGMKLNRDYLVEVVYDRGIEEDEKAFSHEMASIELGTSGRREDRVKSPRPADDFLLELDYAAKKDLGFSFTEMISVLQILTFWPSSLNGITESPSYSATSNQIGKSCIDKVPGITHKVVESVINFLTLKRDEVLRVLGQDTPCFDLPVWEYRKRFSRYNIRPLIRIGRRYHWGPYSTRRAGIIWSGAVTRGMLPTDLESKSIEGVLRSEKKLIEDSLADKALEIVLRYTPHARKNLRLHKLKPKNAHPKELGDYDVLAFCPDRKVVLNIECKDLLPVHCLKDAKRLRETIFGKPGMDNGHFEQINKRRDYLQMHLFEIANALGWPMESKAHPRVETIYVSRLTYWWTRFPPKDFGAVFLRIDFLSDYIQNLRVN
jgi:hypothetical protein